MNKNIENMTEDLMMKYLEGDLSSDERIEFEKIMHQNEYLNDRVDYLKQILKNQPMEAPRKEVHNRILQDLNISESENTQPSKKYVNNIAKFFENRPFALASAISGLVIAFILILNINDVNSGQNDMEISNKNDESEADSYKDDFEDSTLY